MELQIYRPDDFHLHLRQDALLRSVAPLSAAVFRRVLVMPNTLPPITTPEGLNSYRSEIEAAAPGLEALMSFKMIPGMQPEDVARLKKAGAVAAKYYPVGATTNAEDGFTDIRAAFPLFHMLQAENLVLCIHGEDPGEPVFLREAAFLPQVETIIDNFPRLRIVLEHLSSREAVEAVQGWPARVGATITAHHLAFSYEEMLGGSLNHDLFCKPIVKSPADRAALVGAAVSGEASFFFGSDSAPHSRRAKAGGAAGCFSAPVALPLLAQVFNDAGHSDRLEAFTSRFGADFYQLPPAEEKVTLRRESWQVPEEYAGLRPLCAGDTLEWKLTDP